MKEKKIVQITRNSKKNARFKTEKEQESYTSFDRELLNTYFSGLYFSASDLVNLAKKLDLNLPIKGREILLKKIISYSHENNSLDVLSSEFSKMVDLRVKEYSTLLENYPQSQKILMPLITKANATKKLILTKLHRIQVN